MRRRYKEPNWLTKWPIRPRNNIIRRIMIEECAEEEIGDEKEELPDHLPPKVCIRFQLIVSTGNNVHWRTPPPSSNHHCVKVNV